MSDFESLLNAIPSDPNVAFILADYLEERGDPRCELIRLSYTLKDMAESTPERLAMEERLRELLLVEGLDPVMPTYRNEFGMEFVCLPPGKFLMGSPANEQGRYGNEALHEVTLVEPFYLGVYPVTVGQFRRFVEATDYKTEAEKGNGAYAWTGSGWNQDRKFNWRNPGFSQTNDHPVVCVSWNDAQAMIYWLNEPAAKLGRVYSLPTEAQWEYACRAVTQTAYWFGDDPDRLDDHAWFRLNSGDTPHPVRTKHPNPWNLYQMHGNVWEWCEDWYVQDLMGATQNPRGPAGGLIRVLRGGSWYSDPRYCRSARRGNLVPSNRRASSGFRLSVSDG